MPPLAWLDQPTWSCQRRWLELKSLQLPETQINCQRWQPRDRLPHHMHRLRCRVASLKTADNQLKCCTDACSALSPVQRTALASPSNARRHQLHRSISRQQSCSGVYTYPHPPQHPARLLQLRNSLVVPAQVQALIHLHRPSAHELVSVS